MKATKKTRNGRGQNPKSMANLRPPFDGSKPGPGRKKDSPEAKAAKALFRTAKDECSDILKELVQSGRLRTFIVQAIESQAKSGRIDGVRWLCEYVDPPDAPGTQHDPSELLESILTELERTA